jgi:hypothetical protein
LNKWPSSEYAVPPSAKERAVFGFSVPPSAKERAVFGFSD